MCIPCQGQTLKGAYIRETERSLNTRFLEYRRPTSTSLEVSKHPKVHSIAAPAYFVFVLFCFGGRGSKMGARNFRGRQKMTLKKSSVLNFDHFVQKNTTFSWFHSKLGPWGRLSFFFWGGGMPPLPTPGVATATTSTLSRRTMLSVDLQKVVAWLNRELYFERGVKELRKPFTSKLINQPSLNRDGGCFKLPDV